MTTIDVVGTSQEPRVIPARGGFLAVSPPGFPWRIATIGDTEEAARITFQVAADAWFELSQRS